MGVSETGLTLGQFAITLKAESHNPTILNPDFLRNQGIVESDWELAEDPVCVRHFARVAYTNRVAIVAEFDNLIFSEELLSREEESGSIASVAARYVRTLPHVNYLAVVNNFVADLVVKKRTSITSSESGSYVRDRGKSSTAWKPVRGSHSDTRSKVAPFSFQCKRLQGESMMVTRCQSSFLTERSRAR